MCVAGIIGMNVTKSVTGAAIGIVGDKYQVPALAEMLISRLNGIRLSKMNFSSPWYSVYDYNSLSGSARAPE